MLYLLYLTWFFGNFKELLFFLILSQQLLILFIYSSRVIIKLNLQFFFSGYQFISSSLIPQFLYPGMILFNRYIPQSFMQVSSTSIIHRILWQGLLKLSSIHILNHNLFISFHQDRMIFDKLRRFNIAVPHLDDLLVHFIAVNLKFLYNMIRYAS